MSTLKRSSLPSLPVALALLTLAFLTLALWLIGADPVKAQSATPGAPPSPGLGATSPFSIGPGSTVGNAPVGPAGIPLGATELATPGTSFAPPPAGQSVTGCAGTPGLSGQSSALFDGGGLSSGNQTGTSCRDQAGARVVQPSDQGRSSAGVPLGSTELGNAGVSPGASVPLPSIAPTGSNTTGVTSPCTANPSMPSGATAGGGC